MRQSRKASLLEASVGTAAGYCLSVLLSLAVFPAFGLHPTLVQNLKISLVFTLASIARGYAVRRVFERIARRAPDPTPPDLARIRR